MDERRLDDALAATWNFPLLQAIFQRRSRRLARGASHPGDFTPHTSSMEPLPLLPAEEALLVSAGVGLSGRTVLDAGHQSQGEGPGLQGSTYLGFNGRTFGSPCNVQSTKLFFTNDRGTFVTQFRDAPLPEEMISYKTESDVERLVAAFRAGTTRLSDSRLDIPREFPHIPPINQWNVNLPGTTFFIPISDITTEYINLMLTVFDSGAQRYMWDDYAGKEPLAGMADKGLLKREYGMPLSAFERMLTNWTGAAEQAIICQNLFLTVQAIGLGGWMFSGLSANTVCKALGFRLEAAEKKTPLRHPDYVPPAFTMPIGLDGIMESRRPPYYPSMEAAVMSVIEEKWGDSGRYDKSAPYSDKAPTNKTVRRHSDYAVEATITFCNYIWDSYGCFPAVVGPIMLNTYFQAHNLALDFYDRYYPKGTVPESVRTHDERWHGSEPSAKESE